MDPLLLLHSALVRIETKPGNETAETDELRATIALCKGRIKGRKEWGEERILSIRDQVERANRADRERQVRAEKLLAEIKRARKDHGR